VIEQVEPGPLLLIHRCVLIDGSSTRSTCFLCNDYFCVQRLLLTATFEVLPHSAGIERTRQAKRPRERPTALGEIEAVRIGMQRGSPARTLPARIGDDAHLLVDHDHRDTQKVGLSRPLLASHT
jgi:hypothetical protein